MGEIQAKEYHHAPEIPVFPVAPCHRLVLLIASLASAQINPCSRISTGQGANLNGFIPFPSSSLWNTNIANAPLDPNSSAIINFIGSSTPVHADFGAGLYQGQSIGIPYVVVPVTQPLVNINFTAYGDESDPGPMPIPFNAPIEGYPNPDDGDRHVLVIDKGNCWLYELYHAYPQPNGTWKADSAAVWDLIANETAALYLDVGRCRGPADLSRTGSLR